MKIRKSSVLKALTYAFVPSLLIYLLMSVSMFSFVKAWDILTSSNGLSIFARTVMFLMEIGVIMYLYNHYSKIEMVNGLKTIDKDSLRFSRVARHTSVESFFTDFNYGTDNVKFHTYNKNYVILKRERDEN